MTNKQRKEVKRECGVTVPSNAAVRSTMDENECCLEVFTGPGRRDWVPFGATRMEPGEGDSVDNPSTKYYFNRLRRK